MAIHDDPNEMSFIPDPAPQAVPIPSRPNSDRPVSRRQAVLRKASRSALVAVVLGTSTLGTILAPGCTTTSGLFNASRSSGILDKQIMKYRNRVAAEKAWHCRKASFGAQAENEVFKAGFIDGYVDIAEGGKGCTPLVAPKKYWGWQYQSAAGQNAAGSWFGSYPLGVQAAEEDGLGTFRRLPFCDRPNTLGGCGTPACGATPAPIASDVNDMMPTELTSPIAGDDRYDANGRRRSGVIDVEQLDGPAIEADANDTNPSMPPTRDDRSNPFNRSIDDRSAPSTSPVPNFAPPTIAPPIDNTPADSFDFGDLSGDLSQWTDSEADMMSSDPGFQVATLPDQNQSPAPTLAAPAIENENTITIDEIFGLQDNSDGGVEVEFDDLPFSFE